MAVKPGSIRCAIYTRKSSEEGLEQEFNSLDAQREACEAYVTSQKHEGWMVLLSRYDDGGFSGGTMERPARADKSGSAYIQYATVLQAFGGEEAGMKIYSSMLSNFVLSDSSGAVPKMVNDGELAIGLTLEDAALRFKEGGGPVQIVYPSEGTSIAPDAVALVHGGPNTANGQAFIDFILSAEAQTIVANQGRRPVRGDVDSSAALVPLSKIKDMGYDFAWAAQERARLMKTWSDLVLDAQ